MKQWLLIAAVFLFASCSRAQDAKAPDFSLQSIEGKEITLSEQRGKVVVINFWATWCPPCLAEIPDFVRFYNENREKGVEIIGISLNSKIDEVKALADKYNITYPLCPADASIEKLYGGIRAVPTTFIINRRGEIVLRKTGTIREKELNDLVSGLL